MTINDLIARIEARLRLIRATPDVLQKDMIHQMAKASVMDTLDWMAASRTTTPPEQDVERVAEAMEREPLEDVLRDTRSWLRHLDMELRDDDQFSCAVYGYEVIGTDVLVMDATRYGADPVDAIRNAVAAAKGEKA